MHDIFHLNRMPPTVEIEQAILGILLVEGGNVNAQGVAFDLITTPQMFSQPKHRLIFKAIKEIERNIDPFLVAKKLRDLGSYDEAGGIPYLSELTGRVVGSVNLERYCLILRENFAKTKTANALNEALQKSVDHTVDVFSLIDEVVTKLTKISDYVTDISADSPEKQIDQTLENLIAKANGQLVTAIPTPFEHLNAVLNGGWHPGNLIILAARPSLGKSAYALQCATHTGGYLFSLEVDAQEIHQRQIANVGSVNYSKLQNPKRLNESDWERVYKASAKLKKNKLIIEDKTSINALEVCSRIAQAVIKHGCKVAYIDYLQLLTPPPGVGGETRDRQLGAITSLFKRTAKALQIPFVLISSLSRDSAKQNRRPRLTDLRDSGNIEYDADTVVFYTPRLTSTRLGNRTSPASQSMCWWTKTATVSGGLKFQPTFTGSTNDSKKRLTPNTNPTMNRTQTTRPNCPAPLHFNF